MVFGWRVRWEEVPSLLPGALPVHPASSQQVSWGQGADCVLRPTGLQNPRQCLPLTGLRPWGHGEPPPHPISSTWWQQPGGPGPYHMGGLRSLRLLTPVRSWTPGSLSDDSWAGSGNLAPRKPPAETCLLLDRRRTSEGKVVPRSGPHPFLSGQKITLVKRFTETWLPDCEDLQNKGSGTKKFTTNHAAPSPFLAKGFAESFWGVWGF